MTFRVGSFAVTRIEEVLDQHKQLAAACFWHAESGKVMSSMHSWLVRDGRHTILIDTGCGNGKTRAPIFQRFHNGRSKIAW